MLLDFGESSAAGAVASGGCATDGSQNWPDVQRHLFRLLDGGSGSGGGVPDEVLLQAAERAVGGGGSDCWPGVLALRLLLVLIEPEKLDSEQAGQMLQAEWQVMGALGWKRIVASGWPLFRLLRLVQRKTSGSDAAGIESCADPSEPYSTLLLQQVRHRRGNAGGSLIAEGASYLLHHAAASQSCPLSVAAAFLAPAWLRYPVYDTETEDLLQMAEQRVRDLPLADMFSTNHALLDMLDDVASAYQAFIIDSGALYVDARPPDAKESQVDYTRHMMGSDE